MTEYAKSLFLVAKFITRTTPMTNYANSNLAESVTRTALMTEYANSHFFAVLSLEKLQLQTMLTAI